MEIPIIIINLYFIKQVDILLFTKFNVHVYRDQNKKHFKSKKVNQKLPILYTYTYA
jgi:hypothetical protein